MTHRVEQIVMAVSGLIDAVVTPTGGHVYTHRRETLDSEQDELPGISVDFGELEITEETEDELYWAIAIPITVVVKLPSEVETKEKLMAVARQVHSSIMASPGAGMPWKVTLGLAFVITAHPMGWEQPEYDVEGEAVVGSLTTNWRIEFKTDVDDPGDG